MKKVLFIITLLLLPSKIYAVTYCDNQDRAALMPFVNNVNINYVPTINDDDTATYKIMINNLTSDMIVYEEATKKVYKNFNTQNSELDIEVAEAGTYKFSILSLTCKDQLSVKSITLPNYNKFYKKEECTGLGSYPICKRWSNYVASEEEFLEDIEDLRDEINQKKKDEKKDKEKAFLNKIVTFLSENWGILIIGAMILVGGIYIVISKKKVKKK